MQNLKNASDTKTGNPEQINITQKTSLNNYTRDLFEIEKSYFCDWLEVNKERDLGELREKLGGVGLAMVK